MFPLHLAVLLLAVSLQAPIQEEGTRHQQWRVSEFSFTATGDLEPRRGAKVITLGPEVDEAYRQTVNQSVVDPAALRREGPRLKIVYTPLHGSGIRAIQPLLKAHAIPFSVVPEQAKPDGRFPTVASPNPENGEIGRASCRERV